MNYIKIIFKKYKNKKIQTVKIIFNLYENRYQLYENRYQLYEK